MATGPDAPEDLDPPGAARTLVVPLVAGALTGLVLATGSSVDLFRAVNGWPATTGDATWSNLSVVGEAGGAMALCAVLSARRPRLLLAAFVAATLAALVLQVAKEVIGADRPGRVLGFDFIHVIGQPISKRSFPSGHATTSFASAALAFSLWRGASARAALLVVATLVALSRLAVGAHWPQDVLAGAALGWLAGCAGLHVANRLRPPAPWLALALALVPLGAAAYVVLPHEESPIYEPVRAVLCAAGVLMGVPAVWKAGRQLRAT